MKKTISLLLLFIVFFAIRSAQAQYSYSYIDVTYTANGEIKAGHKNDHYTDVEGHPYMYDYWFPGWAVLSDGKVYNNLLLLYDEVTGQPNFKNSPSDSVLVFSPRATEFGFTALGADGTQRQVHFKSGFAAADGLDDKTYYQVLTYGNLSLLKRTSKIINKHTNYGTNEIVREIVANDNYYLVMDTKPLKVKNSNKAVLALMGTRADKVKAFMDSKNLNVKNDADFIEVVKYYNTL